MPVPMNGRTSAKVPQKLEKFQMHPRGLRRFRCRSTPWSMRPRLVLKVGSYLLMFSELIGN
jgi:hypothetical protein